MDPLCRPMVRALPHSIQAAGRRRRIRSAALTLAARAREQQQRRASACPAAPAAGSNPAQRLRGLLRRRAALERHRVGRLQRAARRRRAAMESGPSTGGRPVKQRAPSSVACRAGPCRGAGCPTTSRRARASLSGQESGDEPERE